MNGGEAQVAGVAFALVFGVLPAHLVLAQTAPASRPSHRGATAVMPGFEALADGSTRLFVELSKPVAYDALAGGQAHLAHDGIVYVLRGVHVDRRNNYNPLVTLHFNTPVASAQLVPHGKDLWFVVDLRAHVLPTATMDAAKDGGAMLRIEFPKGSYLPGQPAPSVPRAPSQPPAQD
jgi:hypothetical protein